MNNGTLLSEEEMIIDAKKRREKGVGLLTTVRHNIDTSEIDGINARIEMEEKRKPVNIKITENNEPIEPLRKKGRPVKKKTEQEQEPLQEPSNDKNDALQEAFGQMVVNAHTIIYNMLGVDYSELPTDVIKQCSVDYAKSVNIKASPAVIFAGTLAMVNLPLLQKLVSNVVAKRSVKNVRPNRNASSEKEVENDNS